MKRTILNSTAKTCDVDAFPTHLLLDSVFNDSLASGIFPSSFKTALVKPLLEKPSLNPNDLKNYRPVSNLPFLSKTTERSVLFHLNDHLQTNTSAPSNQHIFHHSTEITLLKIVNGLIALDNGKICIPTLLDLSMP